MTKLDEKDLDPLLEQKMSSSEEFSDWLLSFTKFAGEGAKYYWSRSNNPWGEFQLTYTDSNSGQVITRKVQGETDVLVVFETGSSTRFALHIENKIKSKFTELQPEKYFARANHWRNNPKYGNYEDFQTVLVAPLRYFALHEEDSSKFDVYISYEKIASHIPEFGFYV